MAPFILDESDSKSSTHITTSSVSSPDASTDSDASEPRDLSLWGTAETAMRELEIERQHMEETWREVHGTDGTWEDRAISHSVRQGVRRAQQTTEPTTNAPNMDGTTEHGEFHDSTRAVRDSQQVADTWTEVHGLDSRYEDRALAHRARVAREVARELLAPSRVGGGGPTHEDDSSDVESEKEDDFEDLSNLSSC